MRLFAAIPIASPAREEVERLLGGLRATDWPVRWVRDEGLHFTLKFFGEVPGARFEVIAEAVRASAEGTGPIPLRLDDLGAFPTRDRPRVLWLGLEAPPALELLQDRVERRCEPLGFPPEAHLFQPHVTLGRVREGARMPAGGIDAFDHSLERVPFVAEEIVLFESRPGPGGSHYERRDTVTL